MVLTTESRMFLILLVGVNLLALVKSQDDPIRLTGGVRTPRIQSGRLEIYHNGGYHNGWWGTVCDDEFGDTDARVVCSSIGFRSASVTSQFRRTSTPNKIWLDDVACRGDERRISDCKHAGWGEHNCDHNEDVGVRCTNPTPAKTARTTTAASQFGCENGVIHSNYCIIRPTPYNKNCFNQPGTAEFTLDFKTPPAVSIGYIMLDLDNSHNTRVSTSTNIAHVNGPNVTRTSVTVQFYCWGESECYRVALSYMACGELNN